MKLQDLDIIDQYLEGTLSKEKVKTFEQRLQTDNALNDQFKQTKLLISGIKYSERINMLNKIKQIENSLPEIKLQNKHKPLVMKLFTDYRYYSAAACILVIIAFTLYFISKKIYNYNSKELFEAYFEPYPNVVYPITRFDEGSLTPAQKAFYEYDQKNYTIAIELFKSLPNYATDQTITFYLAIACLAKDDSQQATKHLLSLLNKNPTINDKVKWYLGLCYLKENKNSLARAYFKDLSETENSYTQKAIRILKKIK